MDKGILYGIIVRMRGGGQVVTTTHTVPKDKWVAEVSVWSQVDTETARGGDRTAIILGHTASAKIGRIIGVERGEAQFFLIGDNLILGEEGTPDPIRHEQKWLVVADKPFAVVERASADLEMSECTDNGFVVNARQVRSGELGRTWRPERRPMFIEGDMADPRPKRRRPVLWWTQMKDLAEITGLEPMDLILRYAIFSPTSSGCANVFSASLEGDEGVRKVYRARRIYAEALTPQLMQLWAPEDLRWGGRAIALSSFATAFDLMAATWVEQSWAITVLRLHALGYVPGEDDPEASFELAVSPVVPLAP